MTLGEHDLPKGKNGTINFKDMFNRKRVEINKGQWESINKISKALLKDMIFTVKDKEISEVETGFGYTDSYAFEKDGIEYRLLTKSKVFKALWIENIDVGMQLHLGLDDNGWYFYI